jgi:hypothetical protein
MITEDTVIAANAAIQVLHLLGRLDHPDNRKDILGTANSFLKTSEDRIENDDEIERIIDILDADHRITTKDGIIFPMVKIRKTAPDFRGKDGFQKIIDILQGRVLHLYFYYLKDYVIEFNVDGKGSIKLPTGEIVQKGLGGLAKELMQTRKL